MVLYRYLDVLLDFKFLVYDCVFICSSWVFNKYVELMNKVWDFIKEIEWIDYWSLDEMDIFF